MKTDMIIEDAPSPNHNDRQHPLDMLVLHYTGMHSGQAAFDRLRDPDAKVSAHYLVWEDGRIHRLVPDEKRAWHAGVSSWAGQDDLNSRSIGIEIVNGGHDHPNPDGTLPPYPEAQIESVTALCRDLIARHSIPQTRIVGHSDIAPARKIDPGEHFPWARLADAGVGLWPELGPVRANVWGPPHGPGDSTASVARLKRALRAIGYEVSDGEIFDEALGLTLTAFQRRFLPEHMTGLGDPVTVARVAEIEVAYRSSSSPVRSS